MKFIFNDSKFGEEWVNRPLQDKAELDLRIVRMYSHCPIEPPLWVLSNGQWVSALQDPYWEGCTQSEKSAKLRKESILWDGPSNGKS